MRYLGLLSVAVVVAVVLMLMCHGEAKSQAFPERFLMVFATPNSSLLAEPQCTAVPFDARVDSASCYTETGTEEAQLRIKTDPTQAGTEVFSIAITATPTGEVGGAFNQQTLNAYEWLCFETQKILVGLVSCSVVISRR